MSFREIFNFFLKLIMFSIWPTESENFKTLSGERDFHRHAKRRQYQFGPPA